MARLISMRLILVTLVVLTAALIPVTPSYAQQGCADGALCLDAGIACPGFALQIQFTPSANRVYREFQDKDGNLVRSLAAGKGADLVFTNLATGAALATKANGSVTHVTYNSDGSRTEVATGHNVIILFPGDTPAGPSTVLYVGQVRYRVDPGEVFTLQKVKGNHTDICAAVGG